jgi:DNA polymerase III subunit chi
MTAVQFYHLTTSPLERALPKLMEKAYGSGQKTLLVAGNDARADQINQLLWSYDPGSFLPHGSMKDGHTQEQPILISTTIDPVNNATILVVTDGALPDNPDQFERILDMFDGNDPESVAKARQRWTLYRNGGHDITYMRQNENGGWVQKAVA